MDALFFWLIPLLGSSMELWEIGLGLSIREGKEGGRRRERRWRRRIIALLIRLLGRGWMGIFRILGISIIGIEQGDTKEGVGGDGETCGSAECALLLRTDRRLLRGDGAGARWMAGALRKALAGC